MTFCRVNPQYATYTLSKDSLDRITLVNNLGVLLDPRQNFADHISSMVNKAMSSLGFNKSWSLLISLEYGSTPN